MSFRQKMRKVTKPSFRWTILTVTLLVIIIWLGAHFAFSKSSRNIRSEKNENVQHDDEWKELRASVMSKYPDFDWKAYLELNNDLLRDFHTEDEAVRHFIRSGIKEKRLYKVVPDATTWKHSMDVIRQSLLNLDKLRVPIMDRTLVVYHLGAANQNNSLDVSINNMKMFASAVQQHSLEAKHQAVYLFNVEGGTDNPLLPMIPALPNVAIVHWDKVSSDMITHIRTIRRLGDDIVSQFQALLFFNQGVRGPLTHRKDGGWLAEFRRLLDANNVGMVGSTLSCEIRPHIQTHVFGVRSSLFLKVVDVLDRQPMVSSWLEIIAQYEVGFTTGVLKAGYNVSALVYERRLGSPVFSGTCIQKNPVYVNPTSWCDLTPEEVIFMKWGGEPLRTKGYMCEGAIERMQSTLEQLATEEPSLGLMVPEVLEGGRLYDLYREFKYETWVDRRGSLLTSKNIVTTDVDAEGRTSGADGQVQDGVCFIVRTYDSNKNKNTTVSGGNRAQQRLLPRDNPSAPVRGTKGAGAKLEMINYELPNLLESLLRQTDPHWTAVVFNTDPKGPHDETLKKLVEKAGDSRVQYMEVPEQSRPKFTPLDAGYTATDYVLSSLLERKECKWISVTNGDNIYGSSVVQNVRAARSRFSGVPGSGNYGSDEIDMILNPVDSRNFEDQDYVLRNELSQWDDRCKGIFAQLHMNRLAYTVQPIPVPGGMDLASVFLNRRKLVGENLYFSSFTNVQKYPCVGCQDGYFTEHLVRSRLWNYHRLPIDGLRSIVFHGPSPTWCIASGNVWFDHPNVGKVGCVTHNTALDLIFDSEVGGYYDPGSYWNDRVCLRLSHHGFNRETKML